MKKNNTKRFLNSLMMLPIMTMSMTLGGMQNIEISQNALIQQISVRNQTPEELVIKKAEELKLATEKAQADAIDVYFRERNMPLAGTGMSMVLAAEKNDLDWRLLPAIAIRESTGGKFECNKVENNPFGWGSCKIGFKSNEGAIETVARNLGGNNPNTAKHYDNKTIIQILHAYNPPSVVRRYAEQVMAIMNSIGDADILPAPIATT